MKPTLQFKIGQHLAMTPQLQQAIRLLQLSSLDLLTEIETILTKNPLLERNEEDLAHSVQIHQWEKWGKPSQDEDNKQEQKAYDLTLQEYLSWQMNFSHFSERHKIIGASIIDCINEQGFLELELSDLQSSLTKQIQVELSDIEFVLTQIQQFEPIGVGSRNLKECLLLQVNALIQGKQIEPDLAKKLTLLINQFLPLVAKKELNNLKKKLKVTQSELKILIDKLKTLYPKPGLLIGPKIAEYIIPDLIVFKQAGNWIVELNPNARPKIQLSESYMGYIKQYKKPAELITLKGQEQEAKCFLKALEKRDNTLLKVATCIVNKQVGFLELGEEALKPLILQDIATALGLHESTVSRITSQKFLYTPRGTFELKYFFSTILLSPGGQDFSAKAIKAMIKKMIEQETLNKPFSDGFLAEKLNQVGVPVARRTVNKYREQLGIPPSHARKRHI